MPIKNHEAIDRICDKQIRADGFGGRSSGKGYAVIGGFIFIVVLVLVSVAAKMPPKAFADASGSSGVPQ